jgi:hypothetical protein
VIKSDSISKMFDLKLFTFLVTFLTRSVAVTITQDETNKSHIQNISVSLQNILEHFKSPDCSDGQINLDHFEILAQNLHKKWSAKVCRIF